MASSQHASSEQASFQQAFETLLSRAPGPVFPRARLLYFRKYPLDGDRAAAFRTFLLEEDIQESAAGVVRVRARSFAVVHWQAAAVPVCAYAAYLHEQWQLQPADLTPVPDEPWFRDGGAWARFSHPVVYERATSTSLISG